MYELVKVSEHSYYIQSPAKIGLVMTGPDTVCVIDSGNDKDAGKKVKRHLEANGWKLQAVFNTHSHAEAVEDIVPLADYNIQKVRETADAILEICREPVSFETVLKRLFDRYQLTMTFEQHVLVGSTVRSYLSWMKDRGQLQAYFEENLLLWKAQ